MSDLKNIRSFKVPHNYFNDFDKKLKGKIDLENHKSDFKVPENYFSKVETRLLFHKSISIKLKPFLYFVIYWELRRQ